jgi:hypothetical protein
MSCRLHALGKDAPSTYHAEDLPQVTVPAYQWKIVYT